MLRALAIVAVLLAFTTAAHAQTPAPATLYVNEHYDPWANPYRDLERALERASAEHKRVLLIVGGDWCVWCEILDRFIDADPGVGAAMAESFVVLKVNVSSVNENGAFLSNFPESAGYPDFFILERNGSYLGQQRTDVLERGRNYDRAWMIAFARRWRDG